VTGGEPPAIAPMLAGASIGPRDTTSWVFEPKWDGVRVIGRAWSGELRLTSRAGNDITSAYPELGGLSAALGHHAAVVDGEVIAFDAKGRPSFERLQRRMHVRNPGRSLMSEVPVLYALFDLLWLDGRLLTGEPLTERRRLLDELRLRGPSWQTTTALPDMSDEDRLENVRTAGLEGYVAKLGSSRYAPGRRSKEWVKVKCVRQRELVVGGWSEGERGRSGQIGSLAVGWVDPSVPAPADHPFALRYSGQVGSGLSDLLLQTLSLSFRELATESSPFVSPPATPRGLHWVRPSVVVQVAFNEVTTAGVLRQPSIKGLRNDVDPATVVWTDELE